MEYMVFYVNGIRIKFRVQDFPGWSWIGDVWSPCGQNGEMGKDHGVDCWYKIEG